MSDANVIDLPIGKKDAAYHLHAMTNPRAHSHSEPFVIESGEGIYVVDSEGRRLIDGMAGLWCVGLGYSEKRLADAAYRQLTTLPYNPTFRGRTHPSVAELAARLVEMAPGDMAKVFFAHSGSDANDTAAKVIWFYQNVLGRPQKKKIIGRKGGYHGSTTIAASLSGHAYLHTNFDLPMSNVLFADSPHYWRNAKPGETEIEFADRLVESLEQQILHEGPETIAAFFAEPVMGLGGVILPPQTYFEKVQRVLKKYDILLVADEVICGFGRTGEMFGSETYGIEPDIMCLAKGLTSGYQPLSAVVLSRKVADAIENGVGEAGMFSHGFTYSGHPVTAAVALETLKIYEERDIVGHVKSLAPILKEGLEALQQFEIVGEVRCVGLMAGIQLVSNRQTKAGFPPELKVGEHLMRHAQANGLLIRVTAGDTLVMSPPLVITEAELRTFLSILTAACSATQDYVSSAASGAAR